LEKKIKIGGVTFFFSVGSEIFVFFLVGGGGGVQVSKLTVITLFLEGFWCQKYENRGISVFCPKTVVGIIKSSQEPPDMVKPDFDFPKIDLKSWILAQNLTNF